MYILMGVLDHTTFLKDLQYLRKKYSPLPHSCFRMWHEDYFGRVACDLANSA